MLAVVRAHATAADRALAALAGIVEPFEAPEERGELRAAGCTDFLRNVVRVALADLLELSAAELLQIVEEARRDRRNLDRAAEGVELPVALVDALLERHRRDLVGVELLRAVVG